MKMKKKNIIIILIFSLILALMVMIPTVSRAKDAIYREPTMQDGASKDGLDDMITDAERFESESGATIGKDTSSTFELDQGKLQDFPSNLFSVLLIAATAVTIVVGVVLGIKYMIGSTEQKAEYKKMLLPYVIGCASIYGALGIWKIAVTVLASV